MRPFAFTLLFSVVLFLSSAHGAGAELTPGPAQDIQRFEIVVDG